jgi:hypothetical protein
LGAKIIIVSLNMQARQHLFGNQQRKPCTMSAERRRSGSTLFSGDQ